MRGKDSVVAGAVPPVPGDARAPRTGRARTGLRALIAALALASLAGAAGAAPAAADFESERAAAEAIGIRAYVYGQTLLDTERIFKSSTSVTVPGHTGYAPVNQLSHFTHLVTEREQTVVAPNADTIYSTGWLKLNAQPMVLHVPAAERFNVAELVDPWTTNFANIGQDASGLLPPGDYVIAGPSQLVGQEEVKGLKIVHAPYNRVWVIARTVTTGGADEAAAAAKQAEFKVVPLRKWAKYGLGYTPPPPAVEVTEPTSYHVPGTKPGENALKYWAALAHALKAFPPPAADAAILAEMATVHIGPGLVPTTRNSSRAALLGLQEAVTAGPLRVLQIVRENFEAGFAAHNGWLVGNLGHYGTNYNLRAAADRLGVGALSPNVSVYPLALTDRTGVALTGAKRYVAHFPAGDFPVPVQAFWSMTMYDGEGFFVPNALNRFALGDRSSMTFNLDGSLDVYLQSSQPASAVQAGNWLPAPAGPFHVIMRLYGTSEAALPGILEGGAGHWTPPTILPCLESGKTAGGTSCAE